MTIDNNEQKDFLDEVLYAGTPSRTRMYTPGTPLQHYDNYEGPMSLTSRCKAAAYEMRVAKGRKPDDQAYKLENSAAFGSHLTVKSHNPEFDGSVRQELPFGDRHMLVVSTPHKFVGDLDIMSSYWSPAIDDCMDFTPYNVLNDQWLEQNRRESSEVYDLENMPRFFSRRLYDVAYFKQLEAIHDFYRQADDDHFEYEQRTSELLFKQRLLSMKHLNATLRYGISGSMDNSPRCWMYPPINVPMGNIEIILSALRSNRMPCRYNPVLIANFETLRRDEGCYVSGRISTTKIERFVLDYVKSASRQ